MNPTTPRSDPTQREQLAESFEEATRDDPETFREDANAEKEVEIPEDKTDHPIRGLDPEDGKGR